MNETTCRQLVRTRSGGFCEPCIPDVCTGRSTSMHHRRKPGRVWSPSNILDACGDGTTGCHGWIEANPRLARERGLWLMAGEDSVDTPVAMTWRGVPSWYYLTDTGAVVWPGAGPHAQPLLPRLVR